MESFNLPIMYYALHQGSIIIIFSLFSLNAGRLNNIWGELKCIKYGIFLIVLGGMLMLTASLTLPKSAYFTTISMIIFSIGGAISYPIVFARSMEIFPDIGGTASSAIMAMRALICSVFVAITSYIYDGSLLKVALMVLLSGILTVISIYKLLHLMQFDKKV
jgi:MFS transporter, DHA1 family, multidrug resistance protein